MYRSLRVFRFVFDSTMIAASRFILERHFAHKFIGPLKTRDAVKIG